MADHTEIYRREVIRARYEYHGVPPRDTWDVLDSLERKVAESVVEEQGESAFVGETEALLQEMDLEYVGLLATLNEAFPDGELTPGQIESVEQQSRQAHASFSQRAEGILSEGTSVGRTSALRGHQNALDEATAEVGVRVTDKDIMGMIDRVQRRQSARREAVDAPTLQLVRRRVRQSNEAVASWIREQEGQPGRAAARRLMDEMSDHDRIQRAIDASGQRGQNVRRAIERAGRAAEDLESEGRSLYTNSKRVLQHEQNVAFHEADVLAAEESPAVKALEWTLSPVHRFLQSSPDVCDVLSELDLHGLGAGRYHPGSTPSLPHPYCKCDTNPVVVGAEEIGNIQYAGDQPPNDTPQQVAEQQAAAAMRANLTGEGGPATQRKIDRAVQQANRNVQVAYDAFVDF